VQNHRMMTGAVRTSFREAQADELYRLKEEWFTIPSNLREVCIVAVRARDWQLGMSAARLLVGKKDRSGEYWWSFFTSKMSGGGRQGYVSVPDSVASAVSRVEEARQRYQRLSGLVPARPNTALAVAENIVKREKNNLGLRGITSRLELARKEMQLPSMQPSEPQPFASESEHDDSGSCHLRQLAWTVLPDSHMDFGTFAGWRDRRHEPTERTMSHFERLAFLHKLRPLQCYEGNDLGRTLYHVAVFENVVIADSIDDGNALYYYPAPGGSPVWQTVFRQSKAAARRAGAGRLVHRGDWRSRTRAIRRMSPQALHRLSH